jgi:hypothetical protein
VKRLRGLAGSGVRRSGGSAAEQEMLRGGASGRRFRVWGGGHEVGDKGAGGLRVRLKGKAEDLGGGHARGRPARITGGRCMASEAGGRKEGGGRAPTGGVGVSQEERNGSGSLG